MSKTNNLNPQKSINATANDLQQNSNSIHLKPSILKVSSQQHDDMVMVDLLATEKIKNLINIEILENPLSKHSKSVERINMKAQKSAKTPQLSSVIKGSLKDLSALSAVAVSLSTPSSKKTFSKATRDAQNQSNYDDTMGVSLCLLEQSHQNKKQSSTRQNYLFNSQNSNSTLSNINNNRYCPLYDNEDANLSDSTDEEGSWNQNSTTKQNTLNNKKPHIQTSPVSSPSSLLTSTISNQEESPYPIPIFTLSADADSQESTPVETSSSSSLNPTTSFQPSISNKNINEKIEDLKSQLVNNTRSRRTTRNQTKKMPNPQIIISQIFYQEWMNWEVIEL